MLHDGQKKRLKVEYTRPYSDPRPSHNFTGRAPEHHPNTQQTFPFIAAGFPHMPQSAMAPWAMGAFGTNPFWPNGVVVSHNAAPFVNGFGHPSQMSAFHLPSVHTPGFPVFIQGAGLNEAAYRSQVGNGTGPQNGIARFPGSVPQHNDVAGPTNRHFADGNHHMPHS